jgi:hypothetical protein
MTTAAPLIANLLNPVGVPLTGSGGLFPRLGHVGGTMRVLGTHHGTTAPGRVASIDADYAGDPDLIASLAPALTAYQGAAGGMLGTLQRLAQQTVIRMMNDYVPQPNATLATALGALVAQMLATGQTVRACAVVASVAPGTANTGNAVLAVTTKLRDGRTAENAFAETLTGIVTSDAQSGGTTAGRETLTLRGQAAATSVLSPSWPLGSGATLTLTAVDAAQDQAGGRANSLVNGDFETWASNVPASWHIATGTAGTTVLQSTAQHYDGASSLRFAGNGTEQTAVYQEFGIDTTVAAAPLTQYAVNLWLKTDATPAAGVLQVALVDGAGAVTVDAQGTANAWTVDLTTLGTAWVARNGFCRTPRVLPSSVRLRLKLTTPLSTGVNLFIDRATLAQPGQPYPQSPGYALFSGAANLISGDTFTVSISNDRGGGAGGFQTLFDQLFNMRGLSLLLPSSATPTISGSLIS